MAAPPEYTRGSLTLSDLLTNDLREAADEVHAAIAAMRAASSGGTSNEFATAHARFQSAMIRASELRAMRDAARANEGQYNTMTSIADIRSMKDAGITAQAKLLEQHAPGKNLDGQWPSLAAWLSDITPAAFRRGTPKAALELGTDSEGGYLSPYEHYGQIMRLAVEQSIVRRFATVLPATSDALSIPRIEETTRSGGAVFGGMTATWTPEASTIAEADPVFGEIPMTIKKLALRTIFSSELMNDSKPALAVLLPRLFADAVSFAEDAAFLYGAGGSEPYGVLHSTNPALISVSRAGGNAIVWADVLKMWARLLPASRNRAVWIASHETIPELYDLVAGSGQHPVFVQTASETAPPSLLGRPLFFSEHAGQLGAAGDLNLVDLSYYVIADRQSLSVKVSEHERFSTDQHVIRGIVRVDGRPWVQSALTPANGGDTVSPYVRLAA